jgi:hypothetical protein
MKKILILNSKFLILLILGGFFVSLTGVQAAEVGEQIKFFVDSSYDVHQRTELNAILQVKSNQAYFYVDDAYWYQLTNSERNDFKNHLKILAFEFDSVIYPKERAIFGSEWNPGIDNDKRITILVLPMIEGAGGYFNTNDEYPQSLVSNSNQREMIYLNALNIFSSQNKAFLAHEFQHLITFYQKTKLFNLEEEVWLNEARSEYAPTLCGYDDVYTGSNLERRVEVFLGSPSDSLTEWQNKITDYGPVSLFFQYLVGRYGEEILTRMVLNDQVGIASINRALAELGYSETFSDVFADWLAANYLNDCQVNSEKKYCYLNKNLTYQRLHVEPSASYSGFPNLIVSRSSAVKDWAPVWYRFRPQSSIQTDKDTLKLEFSASTGSGDFRVPYIVIDDNDQADVSFISLDDNRKGAVYIPNFISSLKSVILMPFSQTKQSHFTNQEPVRAFSFTASSVALTGPVIEQIIPSSGPVTGGFQITITGQNFSQEARVIFGGVEVSDVNVINDQLITFIAPSHSSGSIDISVINPDGQSNVLANGFTYQELTYPDGSLLRAKGDYKVYVIKGHYKRWIQSAEIFNAYAHLRWEDIIEVEPAELAQYREAWLIRAANDYRVYEVNADGTKHWLNMTAEQFSISGRQWDMVYIVNNFERDFYQTGADVMFK